MNAAALDFVRAAVIVGALLRRRIPWNRRLTDSDCAAIRMAYSSGLARTSELARSYGVSPSYISAIVRGRARKLVRP